MYIYMNSYKYVYKYMYVYIYINTYVNTQRDELSENASVGLFHWSLLLVYFHECRSLVTSFTHIT